ncbi:MAG: 16S rRNA processing protein RimM [Saprospiraceae bacterium]|nr:16S rRNA processing protein RimM [Saprospiraceae bacterium]MCB0544001.1 16S rRNA processing protein RimM [Saprospiraceae bacterium]MCB0576739.1 16S rRNA processing protein RimM [Saprospiraceae bacterium]MCB9307664.1 16S rRNA processing protein RimM [Lewinellaceae bacterium]MCB9356916.1 16S rRNA processing protein RimM [Lewinellaceae bacterium]
MADDQYVVIGHTKKTHGLRGELKLVVESRYLEDFLKNERIFLDVRGSKIPYFVANVRGKGEMILQLEEVDSLEVAQGLQSREVLLRRQDLLAGHERELPIDTETLVYERITGYQVVDKTAGEIGVIEEVLDMPQQEMATLKYKGREVFIPLNERLILSIDDTARKVYCDLPDGLLDV